jgi:anti-sigma B factor antagonist
MRAQEMSTTIYPRLFVEIVGEVMIASFTDSELVAEGVIEELDDQLTELGEWPGVTNVLLSFRDVRLMSSMMLAVLLKFARCVARHGGRLKLSCVAPDLLEIFRITRFDRLFEIHQEETRALDSF